MYRPPQMSDVRPLCPKGIRVSVRRLQPPVNWVCYTCWDLFYLYQEFDFNRSLEYWPELQNLNRGPTEESWAMCKADDLATYRNAIMDLVVADPHIAPSLVRSCLENYFGEPFKNHCRQSIEYQRIELIIWREKSMLGQHWSLPFHPPGTVPQPPVLVDAVVPVDTVEPAVLLAPPVLMDAVVPVGTVEPAVLVAPMAVDAANTVMTPSNAVGPVVEMAHVVTIAPAVQNVPSLPHSDSSDSLVKIAEFLYKVLDPSPPPSTVGGTRVALSIVDYDHQADVSDDETRKEFKTIFDCTGSFDEHMFSSEECSVRHTPIMPPDTLNPDSSSSKRKYVGIAMDVSFLMDESEEESESVSSLMSE